MRGLLFVRMTMSACRPQGEQSLQQAAVAPTVCQASGQGINAGLSCTRSPASLNSGHSPPYSVLPLGRGGAL